MANRDPKFRWFRTYADIVDNAKIRLLAFEDRWHFVALCALKCDGLLEDGDDPLRERKIALKLGVQLRELDEIKRRLMDVRLIDDTFHPVKWEMRQFKSADLPDGESLEGYRGYVYFIGGDDLDEVKIGYSKNPWARVKGLQTSRRSKLSVVATVKTTKVSEREFHELFSEERLSGEWFSVSRRLRCVINEIAGKRLTNADEVVSYVANYVATTTDTDTDTETETESSPSGESSSRDERATVQEVVDLWNTEIAPALGKRAVRKVDGNRRHAVRARCAAHSIDEWREVSGNIRRSKFLREWPGFSFDWLVKAGNFQKVLEGNYNG